MIEIDGSTGESGGQILRTALTLASITKKPFRICNIRAKRPKPGLQPQHLMACRAIRNVCRGTLIGAETGSSTLEFAPGEIVGGRYDFDIGTAGSVTLVAQTIIPVLLHAGKKSEVRINGGTHIIKSPGYDYFAEVFLPAIRTMGANVESRIIKPGYYPVGGGEIALTISPSRVVGIKEWKKPYNGEESEIRAIIRLSNLPTSIAVREKKVLVQNEITDIRVIEESAACPGNAVTLWSNFKGAYVPGEKGKRAEAVAQETIDALKMEHGEVDRHLADQLLLYCGLASGESRFECSEFTEHFKTNSYIISKFLDKKIVTDGNKATVL